MDQQPYRIRRSFLFPLGLVVLLTLLLVLSSLYLGMPLAKTLIAAFFLLPVAVIFAECSLRQVRIEEDGIQVNKLLRNKRLSYAELTSVDTVRVRKRAFVSLSTEEDFVILSNSYDNFSGLLNQLLEKIPAAVVSEETRQMASNPPGKTSDIFSAWLAVVVLLLILFVQFKGAF